MPRPRKWKKVCCLPESTLYGPLGENSSTDAAIVMSVEEYETIRLIDYEGLTQEESAERMQVARGTVQSLYQEARKKLAESLVDGKKIKIEGGSYQLYDEDEKAYGCRRCRRQRGGQPGWPQKL